MCDSYILKFKIKAVNFFNKLLGIKYVFIQESEVLLHICMDSNSTDPHSGSCDTQISFNA